MATDPQEFAKTLNELLDGVLVCSDKLCHIEPVPPSSGSFIDFKDPTVRFTVLGARDCQPCTDLKAEVGEHPKVKFIYMDDEKDPNSELGFEILERAGWSGTTPAIYIEQNGQILGELWEGAREREPGIPLDEALEETELEQSDTPDTENLTQELVDATSSNPVS